jgi:hypothetical protein
MRPLHPLCFNAPVASSCRCYVPSAILAHRCCSQIARCANSQSPPCRRFPEGPRTDLIVCIPFASAFQRPLTGQHNRPDRVWWFRRPISAFQRPGTQHLLHCGFPSSFHFVPVCWQLRRACYPDFARVPWHLGVSLPVLFNAQRTGCGACCLGYPHQVWWAPPMYIARAWAR